MFRFMIRDMLWLTLVVALVVGLWLQRQEMQRLRGECNLWETRTMQLQSALQVHTGATFELLPTKTKIAYGGEPTSQP